MSERVLIVDDERAVTDSLGAVFRLHGFEVRAAYSAEEAIETIAEWRPDLALLDVLLPGMNGIDLAAAIEDNYAECRVLLFSGCETAGDLLDEALKRGRQFQILAKPAHPTEVLEAVKALLETSPQRGRDPRSLS